MKRKTLSQTVEDEIEMCQKFRNQQPQLVILLSGTHGFNAIVSLSEIKHSAQISMLNFISQPLRFNIVKE